jgi:hypothetical protein
MSRENQNPDIIELNEVSEEYQYVREQSCETCGRIGTYQVNLQELVFSDDIPCDRLHCECSACGDKKIYIFNVSKLFDRYRKQFGGK